MSEASGATVKLVGWQPQREPPPEECAAMREIVLQAAMSLTTEGYVSFRLLELYRRCQWIVRQKRDREEWNWPYRGKRTWDRRVNDAASPKYGAKLVAVTAGEYRLNPKQFIVQITPMLEATEE